MRSSIDELELHLYRNAPATVKRQSIPKYNGQRLAFWLILHWRLSISPTMIESHSRRLRATPPYGPGATLSISIPRRSEGACASLATRGKGSCEGGKAVRRRLLAADNERNSKFARTLLILAIFLLSSVGWMAALNPERRISQYGHTAWRVQDGYFAGAVSAITQTADGYIWIGTEAGLFRFDGIRFVPFGVLTGEQLPSADVTSLLPAKDGSLWIGTEGGLSRWKNEQLIKYSMGGGWDAVSIIEDLSSVIMAVCGLHPMMVLERRFHSRFHANRITSWKRGTYVWRLWLQRSFEPGIASLTVPGSDFQ